MDPRITAAVDRMEITEVVNRFMRACDRGDVDALHACYHPDAVEDHLGKFLGNAHEWIDSIADRITDPRTLMTHAVTNHVIDLRGDSAVSEAYITTTNRRLLNGGLFDVQTQSRCIDLFERRGGEWRIARRQLVMEWCREYPSSETWGHGAVYPDVAAIPRGAKYPDDVVYKVLADL